MLNLPFRRERARLLADSTALWSSLPSDDRFLLWKHTIHRLKSLPLVDVLLCLEVLQNVILELTGPDGLQRVLRVLGFPQEK